MVPAVRAQASQTYRTALLIDRSMPAMWIEIQGSSLNSFWGLNSSFLPSLPKIA